MKTIRRRAVSSELKWRTAGTNRQYRIVLRNGETGVLTLIYEGFKTGCRLPADVRLIPDHLSFRVYQRDGDDPLAKFATCQDFKPIARIGDELDHEAPDFLSDGETPGATAYRFKVRDAKTGEVLVDLVHENPGFLLPPGQLTDRRSEWMIRPMVGGVWQGSTWRRISSEAIEAAIARGERLVRVADDEDKPRVSKMQRPPVSASALSHAEPHDRAVALAIPVTAAPWLSPSPDSRGVLETQWIGGKEPGVVERVAGMLEDLRLQGWFFIDVEMGAALDLDITARLVRRLNEGGHRVGILIGRRQLVARNTTVAQRYARILDLSGQLGISVAPAAIMLADGAHRDAWLDHLASENIPATLIDRDTLIDDSAWYRWRTQPFLFGPRSVAFPTAAFVSTPAHARDRAVRHGLANQDALGAGSVAPAIAAGLALGALPSLTIVEIDPSRLLGRRTVRDRSLAEAWNSMLKADYPDWYAQGWKRSAAGYDVFSEVNEIQRHMLFEMLRAFSATETAPADWDDVFQPDRVAGWLDARRPFEPLLEFRRGARRFRTSAIRKYDEAYRDALGAAS